MIFKDFVLLDIYEIASYNLYEIFHKVAPDIIGKYSFTFRILPGSLTLYVLRLESETTGEVYNLYPGDYLLFSINTKTFYPIYKRGMTWYDLWQTMSLL